MKKTPQNKKLDAKLDAAIAGADLTRQLNPLDALLADEAMRRTHIRNLFADRKEARDAWMAVRHGTTVFANNRKVELESELKEINKNIEASSYIYTRDCDKIIALLESDMATAKAAGAKDAEIAVIDSEIKRIRALKILAVKE